MSPRPSPNHDDLTSFQISSRILLSVIIQQSMPDRFELQWLAVPAVTTLIGFLAYSGQLLFLYLDPGPLQKGQWWRFNILVACMGVSYYRAINVDPGKVPQGWVGIEDAAGVSDHVRQRYCRKCEATKPPRSHHCKVCKRCVPKMDHHCPWTSNCVSHFTFPHFMRFLIYAVTSMAYLERFVWIRISVIWENRHLPSYLGPSAGLLAWLFILALVNTLTLFAVGIILFRSAYDLCCNTTTIETWEIERHEQLLRRARALGGYLDGPDGMRIRIKRQEFPYDIGIWDNICQGMGTQNILGWVWPFSATPSTDGLSFKTNGFEDPGTSWPPPDPDRIPRLHRANQSDSAFTHGDPNMTADDEIESFKRRQQQDYNARFGASDVLRRKPFHDRFDSETHQPLRETDAEGSGEEGWQDSGGSRLKDYGLDEDVEFYDEDDVPLAELLHRRKLTQTA